jgi:hypothetical protein
MVGREDQKMAGFLQIATERAVVRRALGIATVVGAVLIAINHGDAILRGDVSFARVLRMVLTVMVPYCVSTYSSVAALRSQRTQQRSDRANVA